MRTWIIGCLFLRFYFLPGNETKQAGTRNSQCPAMNQRGQSAVQDDQSQKCCTGSISKTIVGAAVKTAELVDALSNAGPLLPCLRNQCGVDKLPRRVRWKACQTGKEG